jgi:hypothetical protein
MKQTDRYYIRVGKATDLKDRRDYLLYRFFEIIPGAISWLTILGSIILSYFWPVFIAIFIILFDVYWLLKTTFLSLHLITSYRHMKDNMTADWLHRLDELGVDRKKLPLLNGWRDITHLIILPFYNESEDIIKSSLQALKDAHYPKDKFIVVLASEGRAGKYASDVCERMGQEFGPSFFKFLVTVHPNNIVGEIAGKGSNENWAGKKAKELVDSLNLPYENVVVSVFDSDTRVYPEYFGCLTWNYINSERPTRSSFQPVPVFNNNIWDTPFFARVVATSSTFWHMMKQENSDRMTTFSSHSMSFKAIVEMGFWQQNIVSEDSRVFWQALLTFEGDYRVLPLHYPLMMDACLAPTLWQTAKNQYKQQRRWGWGVENLPYVFFGFWKTKTIKFSTKLYFIFIQLEAFWSWATNAILLFMLGWLPLALGGEAFNRSVLSYNLPLITRTLMTFALIGMFVSAAISMLLLPPRPQNYSKWKKASMLLQWLFLPVSVMVLGAFPGLDSQTRLMFGKYMGFWVTDKIRKG